jgi:CBS domain-containing protein
MGLFGFMTGNLILILLAFFVYIAGQSESRQTTFEELLRGLPVRTLMTRDPVTVAPDLPLTDLTQQMFTHHHLGFPVVDPATDLPVGLVTLRQLSANPAARDSATVRGVMVADPPTLPLDADASAALRLLSERDEPGRILILESDGRLAGILTKTDLTHALQIRAVQSEAQRPRWEPVPV